MYSGKINRRNASSLSYSLPKTEPGVIHVKRYNGTKKRPVDKKMDQHISNTNGNSINEKQIKNEIKHFETILHRAEGKICNRLKDCKLDAFKSIYRELEIREECISNLNTLSTEYSLVHLSNIDKEKINYIKIKDTIADTELNLIPPNERNNNNGKYEQIIKKKAGLIKELKKIEGIRNIGKSEKEYLEKSEETKTFKKMKNENKKLRNENKELKNKCLELETRISLIEKMQSKSKPRKKKDE